MKQRFITTALVFAVLLGLLYLSSLSETMIESATKSSAGDEQDTPSVVTIPESTGLTITETSGSASIKVPAVDNEGRGVITWLTVDVVPGKGRTLTDINQLLFWIDTQFSIQTAKAVAENYTKMNLSKVDIVYAIETEADVVEGPSAGAALTVATVSALLNSPPDTNVMITGSIRPNGSIGAVGGILEKAVAAKDVGANLFLVPKGQSEQIEYIQERECEQLGPITYCSMNYVPVKTDIEKEAGIDIEEVSTLEDALKYFIE